MRRLILISLLFVHYIASAEQDMKGSHDHPLVTRFPGSIIYDYKKQDFNEFDLPSGPMYGTYQNEVKIDYNKSKFKTLEGKTTQITYSFPAITTLHEIYSSMKQAMLSSKYKEIFNCEQKKCGEPSVWNIQFPNLSTSNNNERRYLSYHKNDVYISYYVADLGGYILSQLDVIESRQLDKNKVKVLTSKNLSNTLQSKGKVIVSGIYFDTGKSSIKSKSSVAISHIAELLKKDKNLKLYVIGHTDNQGPLAFNLNLSEKRADAVRKQLIVKHGINKNRLLSAGVGPYSPVTSNKSDNGKSLNRRVELVKM